MRTINKEKLIECLRCEKVKEIDKIDERHNRTIDDCIKLIEQLSREEG